MIKFSPSLLSADFASLGASIKIIENAGADYLHIDVMDGHFVPNITIGLPVVSSIRQVSKLVFDVHLMVNEPGKFIDSFIEAGADIITIHQEATNHLHGDIQKIKSRGKKACVAINPATQIDTLEWVLDELDMILIMSVNPGFAGQSFIKSSLNKIEKLANIIKNKNLKVDIEVDGGINEKNVDQVKSAGANVIVSGSAFFSYPSKQEFVKIIKS